MKHRSFNYVRANRQRHALTEGELSFLIGRRSRSHVSHIETGQRVPSLLDALAFQIVFEPAPRELFPGLHEHVEEAVMRRARVLHGQLEGKEDNRSKAKRALLEDMAARQHDNPDAV